MVRGGAGGCFFIGLNFGKWVFWYCGVGAGLICGLWKGYGVNGGQ